MAEDERAGPEDLSEELRLLLTEIEREPVPERLLELARKLQRALAERRDRGNSGR